MIKQRKSSIETIKSSSHVIVFFEAPHRLLKTFTELSTEDDGHSERLCVCCREISKIHEEIWRGTVSEAIVWMNQMVNGNDDNSNQEKGEKEKNSEGRIRGEFTVVLGPWKKKGLSKEEISHNVKEMLEKLNEDGVRRSEAVSIISEDYEVKEVWRVKKSEIYKLSFSLDWD